MQIVDELAQKYGNYQNLYEKFPNIRNAIIVGWIYYYFIKKAGQYYVQKYRIDRDLKEFDWKKYHITIEDIQSYFAKVNNNGVIYYSMQNFIELEKNTGDRIIETFYEEESNSYNFESYEKNKTIDPILTLTRNQKEAIYKAIHYKFSLISGFPGTGKSTIIKEIVDYYNKEDEYVWLLAPTGKAVKDLKIKCNKCDDVLAGTIHRFLYVIYPEWMDFRRKSKYQNKEPDNMTEMEDLFKKMDNTYKNPFGIFVIDESSMVSFDLFNKLLDIFVDHGSKLVLVGDNNQLPPIQVGRPFDCLLKSEIDFSTTYLDEIKRTDKPVLCNNIKNYMNGQLTLDDFQNEEISFKEMKDLSDKALKNEFAEIYEKYGEFKVITPQHMFDGGTEQCNKLMQNIVNPKSPVIFKHFETRFCEGDTIIQTENDYNLKPPRVNGDVAKIIGMNKSVFVHGSGKKDELTIQYEDDGQKRTITTGDLKDDFGLFYGASVHKFQGSQERVCVIILSNSHSMWKGETNKKLFYTAISRAQERCILLGSKQVLSILLYANDSRDSFYTKFMKEFNQYEI